MDRGAQWTTAHGVAKCQTGLSTQTHSSLLELEIFFSFLSAEVHKVCFSIDKQREKAISSTSEVLCSIKDHLSPRKVIILSEGRIAEWVLITEDMDLNQSAICY